MHRDEQYHFYENQMNGRQNVGKVHNSIISRLPGDSLCCSYASLIKVATEAMYFALDGLFAWLLLSTFCLDDFLLSELMSSTGVCDSEYYR